MRERGLLQVTGKTVREASVPESSEIYLSILVLPPGRASVSDSSTFIVLLSPAVYNIRYCAYSL